MPRMVEKIFLIENFIENLKIFLTKLIIAFIAKAKQINIKKQTLGYNCAFNIVLKEFQP